MPSRVFRNRVFEVICELHASGERVTAADVLAHYMGNDTDIETAIDELVREGRVLLIPYGSSEAAGLLPKRTAE